MDCSRKEKEVLDKNNLMFLIEIKKLEYICTNALKTGMSL